MRIQEMKSGLSHLKKKVGNERHENYFETLAVDEPTIEMETILPTEVDCELDDPRWSVVSFDKLEAGGLNYKQAAELLSGLDAHGVSGLCIITNEAASRL